MIAITRFHDFSAGHRVHGHENKCAHLHGHNYRIHFTLAGHQDFIGRIMDFSVIKTRLCDWIEKYWDHKFLLWDADPWYGPLRRLDPEGVQGLMFNPTAENLAIFMVEDIGPMLLKDTNVTLVRCVIEETRKCSASFELTQPWRLS